MSEFNPAGTFAAARKVAGVSDARQVRDVKFGSNITYAKQRFLALFADKVPGEDGKVKTINPTLNSRGAITLTPEIYDSEVEPTTFSNTVASAAGTVGDTITLTLDDVSGLEAGIVLNNPGDNAMARIVTISGLTVTAKVVYSPGGSVVWSAGISGQKNLEALNLASADAPTIPVGIYRENVQRNNTMQFAYKAMSQGILQQLLALHGNMGGEAPGDDWKQEQKLAMIDFQRRRENQMVLSQGLYSEGTGASRITHAKGMIGWAGAVVPNASPDGGLSWNAFISQNMAAARETGGGFDVWALCGLGVSNVLQQIMFDKIRITSVSEDFRTAYQRFETPAGNLNLVVCDAFDTQTRMGQMLTFRDDSIERVYLKGLDLKVMDSLELNNILGVRAAIMVCECLMASNPGGIRLHTNILKAA